ncbi:esterase-like activity of phytase family protein [Maridesulfovibrio sp.]|uniref:esterase-like activity of phytase family protein n=1 Tax=Maridesulfovibrio sp. TaxID=2795000 RepID=UPI0029CA1217|nr:esterase-like activity of phytase family protein [Maridesulfovibrio sp.]
MKKILLFVLILCCTPLSLLFGASSKLNTPDQPLLNPVAITLVSEQIGPHTDETVTLSRPQLKYYGSLLLSSPHPAFGGFSDLLISENRKSFLAVSDMGFWLKGKLQYTPSGRLKGVERKAELGELLNGQGKTFTVKNDADAEALCRAPGSGYLVAFERVHRINRYDSGKSLDLSGRPSPLPLPKQIKKAPVNGGIESMALLPDHSILALTEGKNFSTQPTSAALLKDGKWINFQYKRNSGYRPTSAAYLAGGKILILERRYKGLGTLGIRFNTFPQDKIKEGAVINPDLFCELLPPIPRDNYEGLDIAVDSEGNIWIYIISDDNFSPMQHTLLSLFKLEKRNGK